MSWKSSDAARFDLGPLLQGQTRLYHILLQVMKIMYSMIVIVPLKCE